MLPFYHFIDESIKVKKASLGFCHHAAPAEAALIIIIVKLAPAPMEVLATGRGRVQGVVNFYFPSSCYFQTQHIPENLLFIPFFSKNLILARPKCDE